MTDAATVERLAKEMWAARRARGLQLLEGKPYADIGPWEAENETLHENVRCEARAALAAMGNPLPKCTSWLGHKFEARYSVVPTEDGFEIGQATAAVALAVIEAMSTKTYEGDVCVRCGCIVNRPTPSKEQT